MTELGFLSCVSLCCLDGHAPLSMEGGKLVS
jgi:hypothetical protein